MEKIRKFGRLIRAAEGFLYDFLRYFRYAPWSGDLKDREVREYDTVKIYHSLEKSMSFPDRKLTAGWANARLLLKNTKIAFQSKRLGFHDKAGLEVLKTFIKLPENKGTKHSEEIIDELRQFPSYEAIGAGIKKITQNELHKGKLDDPESFFLSRYTIRDFEKSTVDEETVKRAVSLAMKAPSACNRQPCRVYHTSETDVKLLALQHQNGNRGFGHLTPNLIICTSDQLAFKPGSERNQHWIDGGMFAMNLISAFHALGIGACCLNWSIHPKQDKKFRKNFNIPPNEAIVMMIAFGKPKEKFNVCASKRRPIEEVFNNLQKV